MTVYIYHDFEKKLISEYACSLYKLHQRFFLKKNKQLPNINILLISCVLFFIFYNLCSLYNFFDLRALRVLVSVQWFQLLCCTCMQAFLNVQRAAIWRCDMIPNGSASRLSILLFSLYKLLLITNV